MDLDDITGYDRATLDAMVEDMWAQGAYDDEDAEEIRDYAASMSTERLGTHLHNLLGDTFSGLYREYGE